MGKTLSLKGNKSLKLYDAIIVIVLVIVLTYVNPIKNVITAEKKIVKKNYVSNQANVVIVENYTKFPHLNVQCLENWSIKENISTRPKQIQIVQLKNINKSKIFFNKMEILFMNCHSFNTAYGLSNTIEKYDIDILCLNETFENTNNPVKFKDWIVYSSPRPNTSRGGAAICIRPSLNYISEHITTNQLDSIEMTCVKITFKDKKIINIWCPYVPPEKPYLMGDLCKHINNKIKENTVIVGDLNAKSYQWNNKTENMHGKLLEECMTKSKLICINDCQATRRKSDSIIDLSIITQNIYNDVIECTTLSHENIQSDHIGILTKLNSCTNNPAPSENETPKWNINKADLDAWKSATEESFQNLEFFNNQSMEECYQISEDKLMLCMENTIPKSTKHIRKHHKPCWWNKSVEEKKKNTCSTNVKEISN
ncbi:unnamed protein product [Mytilus coruscus]|uniref:Endonuclease/exonuclease/phosphatase domain-containing protein n=1 Tax=Mytilus coruscus TaxID=42192 RepID=A0A6J8D7N6_MYTCO|nr:unnamed protein product [Mytilus coruscus]